VPPIPHKQGTYRQGSLGVALRYWVGVLNLGYHGSHEAFGSTKTTPWSWTPKLFAFA